MSYTKNYPGGWQPGPEGGTPITYECLDNIETQYDEAKAYTDEQIAGFVAIPSGGIIMWSGLLNQIPQGWALCDGDNGTPNLLDRFVVGVPNAQTNPGGTGGATSKTTAGHVHSGPAHAHAGPSHTHTQSDTGGNQATMSVQSGTGAIVAQPGHSHTNPATAASGTGVTSMGGSDNTGSKTDSIADIRPKYFAIAYIMKL